MQFASLSPDSDDRTAILFAFNLTDEEERSWKAAGKKQSDFLTAIAEQSLTLRSCEKGRIRVSIPSSVEERYEMPTSHIKEVLERAFEQLK